MRPASQRTITVVALWGHVLLVCHLSVRLVSLYEQNSVPFSYATCSQSFDKEGVPVDGMKAWLHAFLTLALDGEGVVSLTRRPLHPMGKIYRYPLNRRLSGSQNRPGRFGKEIASVGIRTLGRPPCSLVTILTELFRLHQSSITHGINCVHWLLQKLQIVIYIM